MPRAKYNWIFLYRILPFNQDIIYCIYKHLPKYYFYKKVKGVVKYKEHRKQKYFIKHLVKG